MSNRLVTPSDLDTLRRENLDKSIVFTNGCFDILHRGHLTLFEIAKGFGDVLVVGINSDASVRQLKGELRPVNTEQDRAYLVAAVRVVDYVCIFDDLTPLQTIAALRPNVHVKGGDYVAEHLPEYSCVKQLGGRVEIVKFVDGYSTTNLICKIARTTT